MKFLTEDDLRVKYHQFPFDSFTVEKNHRLTPGARTFLLDRKIQILDENNPQQPKQSAYNKKISHANTPQTSDWQADSIWLDLRCELLQVAVDIGGVDHLLAQELCALERFLATILSGGDCLLPPILNGQKRAETVDKEFIVGNLSNISLFLQVENGQILTRLYPLYFHLDRVIETLQLQEQTQIIEVFDRLGQLIAYYLQMKEEVQHEATKAT